MRKNTQIYEHKLGMTLAFAALACLGTYNAFAKGLTPFLSPVALLLMSELLTAVFIVLTFGLVPLMKKAAKLDQKTFVIAVITGLLNSALAPYLWFVGLAETSAINASMISSADILAVCVFGYWMLGEKITRLQTLGLFTLLAGILYINISGGGELQWFNMGDVLILVSTLIYGYGAVLFKKHLSHVMPELAIAIRSISGCIAVLMISFIAGQHAYAAEITTFPIQQVLLLLGFGFFSRYLYLTFYYESLDRIPATTLTLIQGAGPLSGLIFAVLLLGEQVHQYHIVGGALIMIGLFIEQSTPQTWQAWHPKYWLHVLRMHMRPRQEASRVVMGLSKHG